MELSWSPRSPFVRKVMVFAKETGLDTALRLVRTPVALLEPNIEHVKNTNPLGRIPALRTDDGVVLPESVLICEYLDSLHDGPKFFPAEGQSRWVALRFHALGSACLEILILWRNERMRAEPLDAMLSACQVKVEATLDQLEREAEDLADAPFAIGHIAIGCALGYLDYRFADIAWRETRPKLAEWFSEVSQRRSFTETEPFDDAE